MKRAEITPGMRVLIRRRPGSAYCDEYEVIDDCGGGKWLVRSVDTGKQSERDGRSFRIME